MISTWKSSEIPAKNTAVPFEKYFNSEYIITPPSLLQMAEGRQKLISLFRSLNSI